MQPTHTPVAPVSATTIARTLRNAATYLRRHGWIQGAYYDQTASVFTPAACTVGAIAMVCYGGPVDAPAEHLDTPEGVEYEAAVSYLDRYLTVRHHDGGVYGFNDAKGRDLDRVLFELESAADTWELLNLRCPGCGEPAYSKPPTDWHLPASYPVPAYSHREGDPLCPVDGGDRVTPSEPVMVGDGGK
jgi:hypothetical protein